MVESNMHVVIGESDQKGPLLEHFNEMAVSSTIDRAVSIWWLHFSLREVFNRIVSTGPSKDRLCYVFWSRGSRWLWNLLQPYGWTHQLCNFSIQQLCWHKCSPHGTLSWESTARHEDLAPVHSQIQTIRGKHDAKPPTEGAIPHALKFPVPQKMIEGTACPGT